MLDYLYINHLSLHIFKAEVWVMRMFLLGRYEDSFIPALTCVFSTDSTKGKAESKRAWDRLRVNWACLTKPDCYIAVTSAKWRGIGSLNQENEYGVYYSSVVCYCATETMNFASITHSCKHPIPVHICACVSSFQQNHKKKTFHTLDVINNNNKTFIQCPQRYMSHAHSVKHLVVWCLRLWVSKSLIEFSFSHIHAADIYISDHCPGTIQEYEFWYCKDTWNVIAGVECWQCNEWQRIACE